MSDKTMTTDELRKRLSVAVVDESAYARCLPIAEERDRLARILAESGHVECEACGATLPPPFATGDLCGLCFAAEAANAARE